MLCSTPHRNDYTSSPLALKSLLHCPQYWTYQCSTCMNPGMNSLQRIESHILTRKLNPEDFFSSSWTSRTQLTATNTQKISENPVRLHLIRSSLHLISVRTSSRFSLYERPTFQSPCSPFQLSLHSTFSPSLKHLMASPCTPQFSAPKELPSSSQNFTLSPGSTPPLSQLHQCVPERQAWSRESSSTLRKSPITSLSRRFPHFFFLDASARSLSGLLDPSPYQDAVFSLALSPLHRPRCLSTGTGSLRQGVFHQNTYHESQLTSLQ